MLSNFEISQEEKSKMLSLEPPTQTTKHSLDVIGIPDPSARPQ